MLLLYLLLVVNQSYITHNLFSGWRHLTTTTTTPEYILFFFVIQAIQYERFPQYANSERPVCTWKQDPETFKSLPFYNRHHH